MDYQPPRSKALGLWSCCVRIVAEAGATQQLEDEGVEKLSKSFDELMETLERAVRSQGSRTSG